MSQTPVFRNKNGESPKNFQFKSENFNFSQGFGASKTSMNFKRSNSQKGRMLPSASSRSGIGRLSNDSSSISTISYVDENKRSMMEAKEKARQFIQEGQQGVVPRPITLEDSREEDEYEDYLRERIIQKRKTEQEEKIREEEEKKFEKHKKLQIARQKAELKNKDYTYDYNGKLILVKKPKEKPTVSLINRQTQIGFNVTASEEDKKNRKQQTLPIPKPVAPVKKIITKQREAPSTEKDFIEKVSNYNPGPNMVDLINPERGVIYSENGVTKAGEPSFVSNFTLINGSLKSLDGGPLRMTRSEYQQLTSQGQLFRGQSQNSTLRHTDSHNHSHGFGSSNLIHSINNNKPKTGGGYESTSPKYQVPEFGVNIPHKPETTGSNMRITITDATGGTKDTDYNVHHHAKSPSLTPQSQNSTMNLQEHSLKANRSNSFKVQKKPAGITEVNFDKLDLLTNPISEDPYAENLDTSLHGGRTGAYNGAPGNNGNGTFRGSEPHLGTFRPDLDSTQFTNTNNNFAASQQQRVPNSPHDQFNMDIINSKNWGRTQGSGMAGSLPNLPNQYGGGAKKNILGLKGKMPRERNRNAKASVQVNEFGRLLRSLDRL